MKSHQLEYYERLNAIRVSGDWEGWVTFFLEAVEAAAEDAQHSIVRVAALIAEDRKRVLSCATTTLTAFRLFELLPTMPRLSVDHAREVLGVSFPTAAKAIETLERGESKSGGRAGLARLLLTRAAHPLPATPPR